MPILLFEVPNLKQLIFAILNILAQFTKNHYSIASQKHILVAVLDWGLGHATRSIPIIRNLLQQGHIPILASDGRALLLLKEEFPELTALELPSYNIRYHSNNMVVNMAWQLPRITYAAFAEHFAVRKIVQEYQIEMIISDNRFGCFHPRIKSCFLTHQLNLQIDQTVPRLLGNLANRFWISRYDECWIPDFEHRPNISGILSHPSPFKAVRYLGPLTRMKKMMLAKKYKLCIVLSGPEPQRTLLEKILTEQAKKITGKVLIVKGKTEQNETTVSNHIKTVSFLTSKNLNAAICASEIVVSRSGYSTLMDLSVLGAKALLIPTPGQTEQEYLAQHFHEQSIFMMQDQEKVNLEFALDNMQYFKGMQMDASLELDLFS